MSDNNYNDKIVVFDLDETLGSFVELGMFWDALNNFYGETLPEQHFFEIIDIFPEFLRPNIITILDFVLKKKHQGKCKSIMIYTNNQGPKSWASMITRYFDTKFGETTFDRIISAFKVKGRVVETNRTSHDKSVKDMVRCTRIDETTEICFLDDQYHPLMKHKNVFYINVKPYVHNMRFQDMAEKYYNNNNLCQTRDEFVSVILKTMEEYHYTSTPKDDIEKDIDIIVGKKIMLHLEDFFNRESKIPHKTRNKRAKTNKKGITRKNN